MRPLTPDQVIAHITRWDEDSEEDRDETLTDLLVLIYPTRAAQNN